MTTSVTLRGRAATPVRPGLVTKSVLMGVTPLATGELVHEAAITDLHSAYKELIKGENAARVKAKRLRGMTYPSFLKLFKFAQLLNLVELVREEPMQFPPPGGNLISARKPDGIHAVVSVRRIFKLTPIGMEDERSWTNLCKAWIEGWAAPQKAVYLPPVYTPRPYKERPPKEALPSPEVAGFTPYVWREPFGPETLSALAEHIRTLDSLGIKFPGVSVEVSKLTSKVSGWYVEADEAYDEVKAIGFTSEIRRFENIVSHLGVAREALADHDLVRAASSLEELASQ